MYLVPPHKGHCLPVTLKYVHCPNKGNTFFIGVDIIGKRIIYMENIKNVIFT